LNIGAISQSRICTKSTVFVEIISYIQEADVMEENLDQVSDLEQQMLNASSSEPLLVQARIDQLGAREPREPKGEKCSNNPSEQEFCKFFL
jgi:hypothetical protein